mmetsp:Transcript_18100/g.20568  ORF Transcript_18100/g.20568 Transcript_18100/m.20568 type:complete len:143 (-) Transcript_18100:29-457(-)
MNPVPKSSVPSPLSLPVVEFTSSNGIYILQSSQLSLTSFIDCKITTNDLPSWIPEGICSNVMYCDVWLLFVDEIPAEFTKAEPFYFQVDVTCQQYWTANVRLVFYNNDGKRTESEPGQQEGAETKSFVGALMMVSFVYMMFG